VRSRGNEATECDASGKRETLILQTSTR